MTKAIEWVIKQQQPTGAYNEPGKVLHKAMQVKMSNTENKQPNRAH